MNEIRILREPVANPRPDGHVKSWTGKRTFEPGRYIKKVWRDGSVDVAKVGAGPYQRLGGLDAAKLLNATVPAEPVGIREVLAVDAGDLEGHHASSILGVLLLQGKITREQIAAAHDALEENEDLYERI